MNNPYIPLYVNDYLSEETLVGADLFDHGVWFCMMLLMAKSERRGYLCKKDGTALTVEEVVERCPKTQYGNVAEAIERLRVRETVSIDADGVMYCRRMVKDEEERKKKTEWGKLGGQPAQGRNKPDGLFLILKDSGLVLSPEILQDMKDIFRGVDFKRLLDEAVEENKIEPIVNLAAWLKEHAQAEMNEIRKPQRVDVEFEMFWKAYPRKIGKLAALKAWEKSKERPAVDVVVAAVEKQKASEQWLKEGGQFIPHPATWLNQGRWSEEPVMKQRRGSAI